MYDEMTNTDFICTLHEKAKTDFTNFRILDEAARRIRKLESQVRAWESAVEYASGVTTPQDLRDFINSIP